MTEHKNASGDRLLWLAAGVVALMALTWLVIDAPWSSPEPVVPDALDAAAGPGALPAGETAGETAGVMAGEPAAETPAGATGGAAGAGAGETAGETARAPGANPAAAAAPPTARTSDPLTLAQMALDAGMLVDPPEYSAWTLFGRVAASEPDNAAAREGLLQVAAALLARGDAALEQGRYEDAAGILDTILARLPEHAGALSLTEALAAATAPPEEPAPDPAPPERTAPARAAPAAAAAEAPPVDPIPALHEAFRDAMAQNSVLRPAGSSAVDLVGEMLALAPDHELTSSARDLLVTEMLDRSRQSIEALDTEAAQTWIDSAAPLAADPQRVADAQDRLTQHLIDAETQKILPAWELEQVHVTSPEFPRIPLERGIEGWVEVEFVVEPNGTTGNIQVIDASHERYFREEATAAVREWRFEPVIFMNRPIPKRTYTRLEFVLD